MRKRAFILGNSGELLDHDLSRLKGETVFGLNCLPLRCPEIITDYVCLDIMMAFVPEIRALVPKSARKYYSRMMWNAIAEEDGVHVYDAYPDKLTGFEFSQDRVYGGRTVAYAALQIAASQGYEEIYLLGIDMGLPANGIMHIPEQQVMLDMVRAKNLRNPTVDKRGKNPNHEEMKATVTKNFIYAKSELDKRGIQVFNLSRGGNLNCFPRRIFSEVVKEEVNVR